VLSTWIQSKKDEEGFTLIELLVVVIIIGILAAIAIPVFLNQRENAWARAAQSDLRNVAVIAEDTFSTTGSYAGTPTTRVSDDVTVTLVAGTTTRYCLTAVNSNIGTRTFFLDSTVGRVQENNVDGATTCTA
jgi:type IV pilus assembly protein PilA